MRRMYSYSIYACTCKQPVSEPVIDSEMHVAHMYTMLQAELDDIIRYKMYTI